MAARTDRSGRAERRFNILCSVARFEEGSRADSGLPQGYFTTLARRPKSGGGLKRRGARFIRGAWAGGEAPGKKAACSRGGRQPRETSPTCDCPQTALLRYQTCHLQRPRAPPCGGWRTKPNGDFGRAPADSCRVRARVRAAAPVSPRAFPLRLKLKQTTTPGPVSRVI